MTILFKNHHNFYYETKHIINYDTSNFKTFFSNFYASTFSSIRKHQ